ncbi:putative surface protein with fasciclin (FAS1) repeats [Motilibacter peucedani]|uniref:Putative surface protein with fasciclin (FAS1) repeats n=1 Tax=Motilibacter peucedani TaxID=598650 RepID=A0A420XKZ3_9ACTN|nr:fasciclin domain-containing protein [Motilibacter peucedani]RKS69324.1 putative surface protein with fasciclin (FAS1) repeats [Motilibacter peucedani]
MRIRNGNLLLAGTVTTLALGLSACGSSGAEAGDSGAAAAPAASAMSSSGSMASSSAMSSEAPMASDTPMASDGAMAASSALVGSGCADYAKAVPSGAGSVEGMAQDPVAVAASNNPLLKTLVAAVSGKLNPKVNLVDTLDSGEFTVFAPVDAAFAKVPAATVKKLGTDDALLTKVLTYHVVAGQLAPDAVVGSQKTVEGGTVKVTGSGDNLKVNGANVICGGVKTANATVYLIDSVLMPTS